MVVEEAYWVSNENVVWSINVNRNLNDWEIGEFEEPIQLLATQQVSTIDDQILWKLKKKDKFFVTSYYNHLSNKSATVGRVFPIKQIWKTKVSPRIAF